MNAYKEPVMIIDRKRSVDILLLFLGSIAFLLLFLPKLSIHGDSYYYALSIKTFEGPLTHLGHYAIGHIAHALLRWCGASPLDSLRYMTVFFAGIVVSCTYLFVYSLTGDRLQSWMASAILLFSGTFWLNAGRGVPYVPQLAFVLLSIVAILRAKPLVAGLFLVAAVSIAPTSCLAFPGILYLIRFRGGQKKAYTFVLLPITIAAVAIAAVGYSTLIGVIKGAVFSPTLFVKGFNPITVLPYIGRSLVLVFGKSFGLFSFLALYGLVVLFQSERRVFFLALAFLLPFSLYIFNLGLLTNDHFMVSFFIIAFLASQGLSELCRVFAANRSVGRILTIFLLILHVSLGYLLFIGPENRDGKELCRVMEKLAVQYKPNGIMIAEYGFGITYWGMTQKEDNFFLLSGAPTKFLSHNKNKKRGNAERLKEAFWINYPHTFDFVSMVNSSKIVFQNRPIYFVDRIDWPTWYVNLLLPKATLEKRGLTIGNLPEFQRILGNKARFNLLIESPLYPVYFLEKLNQETQ